MRTYIQYCELMNKCSAHSFAARTPAKHNYWLKQRARLVRLLNSKGWSF